MKRFIVLGLACALAPLATAQLYKYVDKDGKTVYTDQPPANADAKPIGRISDAPSPAKSYVERDKELQKGRDKLREEGKKAEQEGRLAQQRDERCKQAAASNRMYEEGGRFTKYNDKGERVYLGDEELEAERVRTRREMEDACKKT